MPGIPAYTTTWENNAIPYAMQDLGGDGADILSVKNNMLLHIVDYYSKFPFIKKADGY